MDAAVKDWFERALEQPASSRRQFLAEQCADDAVRHEVEGLLAFAETSNGIGDLIRDVTVMTWKPPHTEEAGQQIGAFVLKRIIGRGGMGSVWEAERADGVVTQRVAIKFLDGVGESATRRFLQERQILAGMRHPNIAALYDAGTTANGRPYAVMELVEGERIDAYCDQRRLALHERIAMLQHVCQALQYAHQQLIVHRDIKPANVLVTAGGVPKLLDFGIAKDLSMVTGETQTMALTPAYASSEQILGKPVTVATDVYGLGALLYHLVSGRPPRKLEDVSPAAFIRAVEEGGIEPAGVASDLENILHKALHKDPERRYGTVRELSDDLGAFLEHRPVLATPDHVLYRTRQFARRHWLGLTAAAAVVVSLAVGAGFTWREAQQTKVRAAQVRQLSNRLIFDIYREVMMLPGATAAREKIATTATEYLQTLAVDAGRDPDLAAELIDAYTKLGMNQGVIGDTAKAMQTLEAGVRLADELRVKKLVEGKRVGSVVLAYTNTATAYRHLRQPEKARAVVARALPLASVVPPRYAARIQLEAGRVEGLFGSREKAIEYFKSSEALFEKARTEDTAWGVQLDLALVLGEKGQIHTDLLQFDEARTAFLRAIDILKGRIQSTPDDMQTARMLGITQLWAARMFYCAERLHAGDLAAAEIHYREAAALAERIVKLEPKGQVYVFDWARVVSSWAAVLEESNPAAALQLVNDMRSAVEATSTANFDHHRFLFRVHLRRASALTRLGRLAEARDAARLAEASFTAMKGKASPDELAGIAGELDAVRGLIEEKNGHCETALKFATRLLDESKETAAGDFDASLVTALALRSRCAANPVEARKAQGRLAGLYRGWSKRLPQAQYLASQAQQAESRLAQMEQQ